MKYERWRRIEQLFHAALERDKEQRASFLAEACSDDAALRREVEMLLAANQQAAGILSPPAFEVDAQNQAEQLAASPPGVVAGQDMGHYRILSRIGGGGMGEVFLAEDTRLDRKVAIKFLPTFLEADEMAKKRLTREAKAAAALDHPNICTVYEVGTHGSVPYIAMQNIEGKSIHQLLSRGPLPVERALKYALDIADALNSAHSRGVIHRDIKPSNIMINERDAAVVLDFGLAKQIAPEGRAAEDAPTLLHLTSEMTILGTPGYMSPEQVRREPLDHRSDIFSFGVLVYEMLTAIRPFAGAHSVDVLHAILYDEPKPISAIRPHVGPDFDRVIRKCLAKDRADRYQSFAELRSDLLVLNDRQAYEGEGVLTGDVTAMQTDPGAYNRTAPAAAPALTDRFSARVTDLVSGMKWRVAGVALAGTVLFAAAWWFFIKPDPQSDSEFIGSLIHAQLINWKDQGGTLQDSHGVLSPDGKVITYRSRASGKSGIYTKQTGGGDAREVVVDEWNNWSPTWSPDGQEIAFLSSRGNRIGIWRIPAFGGTPTLVAPLDMPAPDLTHWSKDGTKIYIKTDDNLFSIDLATKALTQITNFDASSLTIRFFSVSPGEDQIAFVDIVGGQHDLWTMPLSGGNATRITNDPEEDRYPVWHPDGKRLIYSSQRDGVFQLCVAYLDGRKPLKLTTGESDSFASDVSPDGTKVLYSSSREESDIWAINAGTGEEHQVTSDVSAELWSNFSPDGGRIAFQSVRQLSQSGNLYKSLLLVRPVDTDRGQLRLASDAQQPRWSPDNQRIAFLRATDFGATIWSVSAVGGEEKQLTRRSVSGFSNFTLPYNRITTCDFAWSPDSERVCYCSEEPEPGLWVCDAEGQRDVKVTGETEAGSRLSSPLWSPDGAHIAYLSNSQGGNGTWSLRVSDLIKGETKTVHQTNSVLRLLGWSPDGALFIATIEGKPNVWPSPAQVKIVGISVEQGAVSPVGLAELAYLYTTELSPDGQLVAFVSRQEGKCNICVLSTRDGKTRKLTTNNDPRLFFSALSWSPDSKRILFDKQSRYSLLHMISNFR